MSIAYGLLGILFLAFISIGDCTANDAYNNLEAPFMALIGGTLAISKDLISDDDNPNNTLPTPQEGPEDDGSSFDGQEQKPG